jgi:hypothetical protein
MKLGINLFGDVAELRVKQTKDGREAFVDIDFAVSQEVAAVQWGEEFAALAFSTMRVTEADRDDDEDSRIEFLFDSVKPGKKACVFEVHVIKLLDQRRFDAQPELLKVTPVDGEAEVIARLRVPLDAGRENLISDLAAKVGTSIKIEFDPKQKSLSFVPRAAPAEKSARVAPW